MITKGVDKRRRNFLKGSLTIGASGAAIGLAAPLAALLSRPAEGAQALEDENAVKNELNGVLAEYTYPGKEGTKGPHYVISIHVDKFDFSSPWPGEKRAELPQTKEAPKEGVTTPPTGGVDYRARKIQEGLYLVHWIVNWQVHVALLLDFVNHRTICAALMPGKTELFDVALWDRWKLPPALEKYQGSGKRTM